MAKLYFRYGLGKSTSLCQTAFNFMEKGKRVLVMNADNNKQVISKMKIDGKEFLKRDVDYYITNNSIYNDLYYMDRTNLACILVDNAHLLTESQAEDLFYIANMLNITVITYGERLKTSETSKGSMRLMCLSNEIERVDGEDVSVHSRFMYYYGAMNCGKTSVLLNRVDYLREIMKEKVVVIKPKLDREEKRIMSRTGKSIVADIVLSPEDSVKKILDTYSEINHIFVDEEQFLTPQQIIDLYNYSRNHVNKNADEEHKKTSVNLYGLKIDFLTHAFPGSEQTLVLCDNCDRLRTVCDCGRTATFNARKVNGEYATSGEQVVIDNNDVVEYVALCGPCYIKDVQKTDEKKLLLR